MTWNALRPLESCHRYFPANLPNRHSALRYAIPVIAHCTDSEDFPSLLTELGLFHTGTRRKVISLVLVFFWMVFPVPVNGGRVLIVFR